MGGEAERPAELIDRASRELLDRKMLSILKRRSRLLQELFDMGVKSRGSLDLSGPEDVVLEQVRKDLEDLACELERLLPSLPRECSRTHRKLKTLAIECNSLASRYFQLTIRTASHGP